MPPRHSRRQLIHAMASANPSPISPTTFSAGTRTSEKCSSPVSPSPSIVGMSRPRVNPGPFASMRNIDSDRVPAPGSVTAVTCRTSAKCELVIHAFVPLRIQSTPSRRACVSIASTSVPTDGSVLQNAAVISPSDQRLQVPLARGGRAVLDRRAGALGPPQRGEPQPEPGVAVDELLDVLHLDAGEPAAARPRR